MTQIGTTVLWDNIGNLDTRSHGKKLFKYRSPSQRVQQAASMILSQPRVYLKLGARLVELDKNKLAAKIVRAQNNPSRMSEYEYATFVSGIQYIYSSCLANRRRPRVGSSLILNYKFVGIVNLYSKPRDDVLSPETP